MIRRVARSDAVREIPLALYLIGLLLGSAWFAQRLVSGLDFFDLLHLFQDDAFYYFQIARNLAEGKFSTFDGGITLTNGYHPAWVLMLTPLYWIFDLEEALGAIKVLEIGLIAGGIALLVVAARIVRLPWILLAATPALLARHGGLLEGMEAAASVFALGALFAVLSGYARNPARWKWPLAAIAFALPWVRLEYVAVALASTGALFLFELSGWGRGGEGKGTSEGSGVRKGIASVASLPAFAPLAAAGLSLLTYFSYNRLVFGGPVPVSGAVKQMWSRYVWDLEGGYDFVRSLQETAQLAAFDGELLLAGEICAYLALVAWMGRRRRSQEDWFAAAFLLGALGLAIGHLATFGNAVLNLHPVDAAWPWYFVPATLMAALMIPLRCYVGVWLIRRTLGPQAPRLARKLVLGVIVLGLSIQFGASSLPKHILAFASPDTPQGSGARIAQPEVQGYLQRSLVAQKVMNSRKRSRKSSLYRRQHTYVSVQVMNKVLPERSVVGVWNAGVVGYFAKFPVVNLDGLASSYEFLDDLKAIRSGSRYHVNHLNYYRIFSKYGITHFADAWIPEDPDKYLQEGSALLFEGTLFETNSSFKIVSIDTAQEIQSQPGSWRDFWQRMEPYWDYQADAVSLFVEGRIVQAFAKDCRPEALGEDRLVFSWRSEDSEAASASWQPWTNARKNSLGYCAAAYVLPKNATGPIEIRTARANAVPELAPKPEESMGQE